MGNTTLPPCPKRTKYLMILWSTLLLATFLLGACKGRLHKVSPEERRTVDSIVYGVHNVDSLALLQKQLELDGNRLGCIVALREWGKALREESRFEEALKVHGEALRKAEALGDTLELVQALNYIGTNYRRLGILDAAQEHHYRALKLCEQSRDTSFTWKKNYVKSLNGLGNIYMTLGNYARADSVLRIALAGERELNSNVGQAIDYANIASVMKARGQIDSAWVYYRRSMEFNEKAENRVGISLCHTYFGSLYEQARKYEKAYEEYRVAYELMKDSKDEWHALEPLLALAKIDYAMGNDTRSLEELNRAEITARRIKSKEHLAEIHHLYYQIYERRGDYRNALENHIKSARLQDSVVDMEKMNRIQNVSLNIERHQQAERIAQAQRELESERTKKAGILYFSLLLTLGLTLFTGTLIYSGRLRRRNHLLLKRMNNLRELFFTNITHEFRTPLTLILGLSKDILQEPAISDEVRRKSEKIQRQSNSLFLLINQLLDIAKMKSEVSPPDWRSGDIVVQISMIIESYRDYARSQNIVLQFFSKGSVEMDFVPDYINKVMNNLLSNAFKFTPEYKQVNVSVWCENDWFYLDVADTGKGIAPKHLDHLFEPFYQGDNESSNIGTGVGLSLVKQILDSIGGRISVESQLGVGTTFHLSLPIRHDNYQPVSDGAEHIPLIATPMYPETQLRDSDIKDDDTPRILVIEDNTDVAAFIGEHLEHRYAMLYATDGEKGWKKAIEVVPDLIITDLMMPRLSGLELCRRIRQNEVTSHIPIIVITAKISEADRIRGIQAGADVYLNKPFNSSELNVRIEKLLQQRKLLREKFAKEERSPKEEKNVKEKPENEIHLSDVDRAFLAKVTDCIYKRLNSGQDIDVNLLASTLCMSYSQFYRKISALTGGTPLAYLQRIKIRRACHLLKTSPHLTFRDIADRCGFYDYSNFVRSFKNVLGITPKKFVEEGTEFELKERNGVKNE